jgi:hypothetical protein
MRRASVLLVLACCAHRPPPIADEWAPPAEPGRKYPLSPIVRSASGGAILVVGDSTVAVPYARYLTLRTAVALSGQTGNAGLLVRGEDKYDLPVAAILDHRMPDPELAPGDVIVLREELCASVGDECD